MRFFNPDQCKVCIVGLGYVGLPLSIALAKTKTSFKTNNPINRQIIGFDKDSKRIEELKKGIDSTNEVDKETLKNINDINFSSNEEILKDVDFFIVAIPTPIDQNKKPDLSILENACIKIGKSIRFRKSNFPPIIVFESTVYPGCTEEKCVPILEKYSNLKHNSEDPKSTFYCGYSPERINPGDKKNNIENIIKIVSGCNEKVSKIIDDFYSSFIKAGTFRTSSIKVAEAAKIIENTQRDINIALVNELAIICEKLKIDTLDVLKAAGTKWNFQHFQPGLVGGHCISVDPYYLTYKAEKLGYTPKVVLAGRNINDGMSDWLVNRILNEIKNKNINVKECSILIMGLTFKENCPDIRNSKVFEMIKLFKNHEINVSIFDPLANKELVMSRNKIKIDNKFIFNSYDVVIVAVAHDEFKNYSLTFWRNLIKKETICFDLKGILPREINAMRP